MTVQGFVLFRGQPLAGGTIVFTPDRDRGTTGKTLSATIEADGRYQLESSSIQPGWYRVSLAEPAEWHDFTTGFPTALRRPDLSGLEREVRPGRPNSFDFFIELTE